MSSFIDSSFAIKKVKYVDYFYDDTESSLEIYFYKDGSIISTIYDIRDFKNIGSPFNRKIILEKNEQIVVPFEPDVEEIIKNYRLL